MKKRKGISIRKAEYMCIFVVIIIGLLGFALGNSKGSIISTILQLTGVICFMTGLIIIIFNKIDVNNKVDHKVDEITRNN